MTWLIRGWGRETQNSDLPVIRKFPDFRELFAPNVHNFIHFQPILGLLLAKIFSPLSRFFVAFIGTLKFALIKALHIFVSV